jgi:hypothetical protein
MPLHRLTLSTFQSKYIEKKKYKNIHNLGDKAKYL